MPSRRIISKPEQQVRRNLSRTVTAIRQPTIEREMGGDASLLQLMAKQLEEASMADVRHSGRTAKGERELSRLLTAYP